MVTVYDVRAEKLIEKVAERLKSEGVQKPEWVGSVKTGSDRERLPEQEDFWYRRCASILRQAYMRKTIGVERLRGRYARRKRRGVKPNKKAKTGGNIIRKAMRELESRGYLEKKKVGREITGKGRALLDAVAYEIKSEGSS